MDLKSPTDKILNDTAEESPPRGFSAANVFIMIVAALSTTYSLVVLISIHKDWARWAIFTFGMYGPLTQLVVALYLRRLYVENCRRLKRTAETVFIILLFGAPAASVFALLLARSQL